MPWNHLHVSCIYCDHICSENYLHIWNHMKVVPRHKYRSEEHTSELQPHSDVVCRLLLEKKIQTLAPQRHRTPQPNGTCWLVIEARSMLYSRLYPSTNRSSTTTTPARYRQDASRVVSTGL